MDNIDDDSFVEDNGWLWGEDDEGKSADGKTSYSILESFRFGQQRKKLVVAL